MRPHTRLKRERRPRIPAGTPLGYRRTQAGWVFTIFTYVAQIATIAALVISALVIVGVIK
jgi:hypothetical protein